MTKVQFNLLPAVKLEYIRAQAARSKVTKIATAVSIVSISILVIMISYVQVVQKAQLNSAATQITSELKTIQAEPDITKVLTVQNQLNSLSNLHASKHETSRLFDYLTQLTPQGVQLSRLSIDYSKDTITIDGTADSATSVNKFVDTLKFTKFGIGSDTTLKDAFTSVVETNFNLSSASVSYSLNLTFDQDLFANNLKDSSGKLAAPKLSIPNQTTTRSSLFSGGQ